MSESRDVRIMQRIVAGDRDALASLFNRHAGLLAVRLRRAGASPSETEDVLQETFLDVWRSAASFNGDGAVAAWLWGVARQKLAMLVRSESRSRGRELKAANRSSYFDDEGAWAASIDAHRAMERLDPEQRSAFEMVVVRGLSVRDTAGLLGVPEGTIKSRVHRARRVMREEMR